MYEFSRALYRDLGPWTEAGCPDPPSILTAIEAAVDRVQENPESIGCATRWLFREIRHQFPLARQADVRRAVDATCLAAANEARRRSDARLDHLGRPRRCPVFTRNGTPCRREPLGNGHCPSHQHLLVGSAAPVGPPAAA
jgi:hypothetical protein